MSTTTAAPVGAHPIVDFASRLAAALTRLWDAAAWSMTPAEQAAVVVELAKARAGLQELELRVLAAADRNDVAALTAATSTTAWLTHATVSPPGAAHADLQLAAALDGSFAATRDALAAGAVDVDRARVIVRAVQALPEDAVAAEPGLPARAEAHLLDLAHKYDARKLKALARHLMEVLDPDGAEERLGRQLEAEEARAARATSLEVRDNGDGTHTGRFKIGTLHAAMLKKALEAILNPARNATGTSPGAGPAPDASTSTTSPDASTSASTGGDLQEPAQAPAGRARRDQSRPEQYGHAFCELLERISGDQLPQTGGGSATVVVTLDIDALLTGLGTATLDTGEKISAGLARRLACQAGVIPAVIRKLADGTSVVLDMGRERRLHTKHMRIALGIEQGGCTAVGCTRPPGWCHAHHDLPWADGGDTSVTNGRLLCGHHHRKAHSTAYDMTHLPDGKVRFNRRT